MRQRSRITYLAEGDANTKFFHLQACHRSRKNYITKIRTPDAFIFKDNEMAQAIFDHFDSILGTPGSQELKVDFDSLLLPALGDSCFDHCFSEEEIWEAINDMPVDKALGPDGFTGLFYKTAWSIVKADIMRAFQAIWSLDARSFFLVNQAYMVLLRKKNEADEIGDFRPISLVHSFAKLFTKVLARRLAPHMCSLVRPNQSAFIRTRVIHENYKAVHLTAKLLHRSKVPSSLLKIDIAKAFDTVNWVFLLELLQHFGFSRRWVNWISILLSSASTRIILNGSPGRRICHARGLRQGDPLSPLLFVLVMEVLNALLHLADEHELLDKLHPKIGERIFLYADDVVIFSSTEQHDLMLIRIILEIFGCASGLKVNPNKCHISPIQCDLQATANLVANFPGKIDPFPIKYLGIPLGILKLGKSDLQPLVDKVANRLPRWKAGMMTRAGRTVLIKSTLSAIPIHTSFVVKLSPWVISKIDSYRRNFLWRGAGEARGGHCLLAWASVCRPPDMGGLGIIDLHLFGRALRMKWLWQRRSEDARPWHILPDGKDRIVEAMFEASICVEIGNGCKARF